MKSIPEIYVLRHGETVWNRDGRWQGSLDSALTEKGRRQAAEMSETLRRAGVSGASHVALTSPQGRAIHTADIALRPLGMETLVWDDLREIGIGDWTGLTKGEMKSGWPDTDVETWLDVYSHAPGGEGFAALWERVGRVLQSLEQPSVLVTHGITSRLLRTRAMGLGLKDMSELPGGQGVIHHICDGVHRTI